MDSGARGGPGARGGMDRISSESNLYAKVIPRHLRTSAGPPQKASTPAHLNPTCPVTQPEATCPPHRKPAYPPASSEQLGATWLSVTAELKPTISHQTTAQSSLIQQSCPGSDRKTDGSADKKTLSKVLKHDNIPCDDRSARTTIDDDEKGNNKDDGYCALKRCSISSARDPSELATHSAGFVGRRRWTSERRRHKEEWCPPVLREKRHQRSESSLDPTGPIWRNQHGNTTEGSPTSTQCKQGQRPASLTVDAYRFKHKKSGSVQQNLSVPAHQVLCETGKTSLTLEEACQLVFPHASKELRQIESSHVDEDRDTDASLQPRNQGRQTDTCSQSWNEDGRAESEKGNKPAASSVSETLDSDHKEEDHSIFKNAGETTKTAIKITVETTDFETPLSGTDTLILLTSERESTEDKVQKQGDMDGDHSSVSSHNSEGSLSSRQQCTADSRPSATPSSGSNALVAEESRAIDILKSCLSCLEACSDVRVMKCFHLLCERCITDHDDEDSVQCKVCGAQQNVSFNEVPLLRDLFPGLFDMVPSRVETTSPVPAAGKAGVHEYKQGSEDSGRKIPNVTALLKSEQTNTEPSTVLQSDAEEGEKLTKLESTAGSMTDVLQTVLDQPDEPFHGESPHSKTKQASSAINSSRSQELSTDSSDNDNDSHSTTSLSDSSEEKTLSGHETTCDEKVRVGKIKDNSKGSEATRRSQQTKTCGACHVQAVLRHVCVTCGGIGLCAGCRVAHANLPVTRSHEVVTMSSSLSPQSLSPLTLLSHHQPLCATHGQDLALQCCTCAQLLCHRCLIPRHVSHEVRELGQLQHASHKRFSVLKRGIKQHTLTARSSHRAVTQQLDKVALTRQNVRQDIHDSARRQLHTLTSQTQQLTRDVETITQGVLLKLTASLRDLDHVQREGERLRCLVNSVRDDTSHLTSLIIHNVCQVWFDQLRQRKSLQVGEVESVAFCPNLAMEDQLAAPSTLGRVCTLATSIPDTSTGVRAFFKTPGEVSALAVTPYKEVVCISSPAHTCQVWDWRYGVMLCDVSRHVTDPTEVKVTPNGILVVLGRDVSKGGQEKACVTYLSPSGSLLSVVPLPSQLQHTHMDCHIHSRLLVSDGEKKTITLYSVDHHTDPIISTVLRQIHDSTVINPRHLTITVTGDWLFNDQGYFMKVVSPEGRVTTVLTEDEPEAILQPPRSSTLRCCRRMLSDVCCDARGRIMAADSGKNGLYLVTSGSVGGGERHFVSMEDLTSSGYVTAMTVDMDGTVFWGMNNGSVYIMSIGQEDLLAGDSICTSNE